jgi:beta-lactamase class A
MYSDLALILNGLGGRAACVAISMSQEEPRELLSLHADEVFPAASLAKVPIYGSEDQQWKAGQFRT